MMSCPLLCQTALVFLVAGLREVHAIFDTEIAEPRGLTLDEPDHTIANLARGDPAAELDDRRSRRGLPERNADGRKHRHAGQPQLARDRLGEQVLKRARALVAAAFRL